MRSILPFSYVVVLLIILCQERLFRKHLLWYAHLGEDPQGLQEVPVQELQIAPTARIRARAICNDSRQLSSCLNFTSNTVLNFMHFSKTGGTSVANYLVNNLDNCRKEDGSSIRGFNACYPRKSLPYSGLSRVTRNHRNRRMAEFDKWRCDWDILQAMGSEDSSSIDYIYGHQYFLNGAQDILPDKDVRTFAVIRHPLARKISFFYHFLIREQDRKEQDVTFEELRDFLIYDKLVQEKRAFTVRHDIGPNYMTGRLLSDGTVGFTGELFHKYFKAQPGSSSKEALNILKSFVFVGLQTENQATLCMFKKTLRIFKEAHNVGDLEENEQDSDKNDNMRELNSGSYALSEETVRAKLSDEELAIFERKEQEDITLYEQGVQLFWRQVKEFDCEKTSHGQ